MTQVMLPRLGSFKWPKHFKHALVLFPPNKPTRNCYNFYSPINVSSVVDNHCYLPSSQGSYSLKLDPEEAAERGMEME